MYAKAVLKAMLGQAPLGVLPTDLIPVDRICQRWASSVGTGLAADFWGDDLKSRVPPLDDWTVTIVDQIIIRSPHPTRVVIPRWYRTPLPCQVIAEQVGMSERGLQTAWRVGLGYLYERFEASCDFTLLRLLHVRV